MNEEIYKNKQCSKCKEIKSTENFHKSSHSGDGLQSWCKKCVKVITQNYYKNNKEKQLSYCKQYQKDHKEKIKKYQRNYYNTPAQKEYFKQYRNKNREKIRLWKRQYDRQLMLNPAHRLSNNIRGNMYHALKAKKGFRKWEDLVGYTLQDLINHLTPLLKESMTWDNYGILWQVDHITPKSWFKYETTDDSQFKECWALSNLQPKLKIDNIKKGNRFIG